VLSGALYGIGAADPMAWTAAILMVAGVTSLATAVPAVRAMRIDPARTLRAD
jgi:ABC-type lipoprotein release transport system permease subunit